MKITNPTVFLKDGELFCLTVTEIPQLPPRYFVHYVCDGKTYETGQGAAKAYTEYLEKAKSSAVKVKNREEFLKNWYRDYLTPNPGGKYIDFDEFLKLPKVNDLYTLTGYEAEVGKEFTATVQASGAYLEDFATITPIHKEEESQEELWSEVVGFLNVPLNGPANYERMLSHLNKRFTITRKN